MLRTIKTVNYLASQPEGSVKQISQNESDCLLRNSIEQLFAIGRHRR